MASEAAAWCTVKEAGKAKLHRCTLCVSAPASAVPSAELEVAAPFAAQTPPSPELAALEALPNASVLQHRVTRELLHAELQQLRHPVRVVVSGPAGFNGAVKEMLVQCGVDTAMITILSA